MRPCNSTEQVSLDEHTLIVDYQKLISCVATGGQLGDEHINAVNQLLRSQFPDFQGLCTPVLGQRLSFPEFNIVQGYAGFFYLQVLHTGADHWVTIEISSQEEVRVYDSVFLKPTYHTLKQIASIVKSKYSKIHILLEKVQCQKNAVDCGIYAVAFLTDLCHRLDPASCNYASSRELRKHLVECFQQGRMSPFPSVASSKARPLIKDLNVYCSCRLPYVLEYKKREELQADEDVKMIQCDFCSNWYHSFCANLTADQVQRYSKPGVMWLCEFKGCSAHLDDLFKSDSD